MQIQDKDLIIFKKFGEHSKIIIKKIKNFNIFIKLN